jgi:hypothetical protein
MRDFQTVEREQERRQLLRYASVVRRPVTQLHYVFESHLVVSGWPRTHYVAETGLKLEILLPQPPWRLSHPTQFLFSLCLFILILVFSLLF